MSKTALIQALTVPDYRERDAGLVSFPLAGSDRRAVHLRGLLDDEAEGVVSTSERHWLAAERGALGATHEPALRVVRVVVLGDA